MRVKNFNDPVSKSDGKRTTLSEMGSSGGSGGSATIYGHWLSLHDSANNRTAFTIIYNSKSDGFTESSLISYLTNLEFVGGDDKGNCYPCVGWRTSGTSEPILGIKTNTSSDKIVFVGGSSGSVGIESSKLTITEKIFTI